MSLIKLEDVHKSYFLANGEEIPILKGISLEILKNEFVAIMGESGSGKSTLLNILGCLHPLNDGRYFLEGEDVGVIQDDYSLAYIRNKKIGFIFQQFNLIPKLTALKNVALPAFYAGIPKLEREEKAIRILKKLGLEERLSYKPNQLSGGQQQRVSIARSLINDPEILLADEPTGALDTKTGAEVLEIFFNLKDEGKTIIMVTHTPEIAKFADRIIWLRDGQVLNHNYKINL